MPASPKITTIPQQIQHDPNQEEEVVVTKALYFYRDGIKFMWACNPKKKEEEEQQQPAQEEPIIPSHENATTNENATSSTTTTTQMNNNNDHTSNKNETSTCCYLEFDNDDDVAFQEAMKTVMMEYDNTDPSSLNEAITTEGITKNYDDNDEKNKNNKENIMMTDDGVLGNNNNNSNKDANNHIPTFNKQMVSPIPTSKAPVPFMEKTTVTTLNQSSSSVHMILSSANKNDTYNVPIIIQNNIPVVTTAQVDQTTTTTTNNNEDESSPIVTIMELQRLHQQQLEMLEQQPDRYGRAITYHTRQLEMVFLNQLIVEQQQPVPPSTLDNGEQE
jgi:hypothetical protein